MRKAALGLALASLTLATACGGDSPESTAAPSESAPIESSAAPSSPGGDQPALLTGTVGSTDDPDAFVITLTDDSGQPVTSLSAGEYQIQVSDLSAIHNFHLMGGAVDEKTTVSEVTEVTFDVSLQPGDYTFLCDPHAQKMVGEFSVT